MSHAALHTKSHWSYGYGTASVEDLVERASRLGIVALALTDVENLYGQVLFHEAARARGIRPITGVELRRGYGPRSLGDKKGRLVLLARNREGYESLCRIVTRRRTAFEVTPDPLDCLEDGPSGVFYLSDDAAAVHALLSRGVSSKDVRFLLVRPGGAAAPEGVATVADPDVVFADPADAMLHRLLVAIRLRRPVASIAGEAPERSLRSLEDAEAMRIAEACDLDLRTSTLVPILDPGAGESPDDRIARLTRAAVPEGPAYARRLERELDGIRKRGLASYLLAAHEIAGEARRRGISIAGRGSAGGSLAVQLLGASFVDPVRLDLSFERFLHAGRHDPPDVDLDVAADRRDELLDAVLRRFGPGRAAMVGSHQTFRRRSALREGWKALGRARGEVETLSRLVPEDDDEALPAQLLRALPPWEAPLLARLVGKPRHMSVHPGGVVIAWPSVERHVPLERAPKGVLVTQLDLRSIGNLGLVKIDLLGSHGLAAIDATVRSLPSPPSFASPDAPTSRLLGEASTIGCAQIETGTVRATLRVHPIERWEDLIEVLALVRPGPAGSDFLYEDQVTEAIARSTGWTREEAEIMRAAIVDASGNPGDLAALEARFRAASEGRGRFEAIAKAAAYTFNKAHAASYAQVAWRSAFLKANHPREFGRAVLEHYGGGYPLRGIGADLVRSGIALLPPDVNLSGVECSVAGLAIRIGLGRLRGLTDATRSRILASRPFDGLPDVVLRARPSFRELEALVLSGACDDLAPLSRDGYPFAHERVLELLRSGVPLPSRVFVRLRRAETAAIHRKLVRVRNELRFLGLHPSAHPMEILRPEAEAAGCIPIASARGVGNGTARIAAIADGGRRPFTTLEDETGTVEAVHGESIQGPGPWLVEGQWRRVSRDPQLAVRRVTPFHERPRPYAAASGR